MAVVERGEAHARELLLVRRAERAGDPWSRDWALPGGFGQEGDDSPAATARRETMEELGLPLGEPRGLLRARWIFDPWRRRLVQLVPVRFGAPEVALLQPDPKEIAEAAWIPWSALKEVRREWLWIRGRLPWLARVRRPGQRRIWGLTGAILDDLARAAHVDVS